jgi:hypothetical protein
MAFAERGAVADGKPPGLDPEQPFVARTFAFVFLPKLNGTPLQITARSPGSVDRGMVSGGKV